MLFFTSQIDGLLAFFDEDESRHIVSVLRLRVGDTIQCTDGRGHLFKAALIEADKKKVAAHIVEQQLLTDGRSIRLHIAIAPTKHADRFEWFLEKATEIGVDEITPMICHFSERKQLRLDRMEKILQSAMKQSLRVNLPLLNPPCNFATVIHESDEAVKCIAWCQSDKPAPHFKNRLVHACSTLLLIGPEGDFSKEEIALAQASNFEVVSLGKARLRTETAGVFAAAVVSGFCVS